MERAVISPSINQSYLLCPSRAFPTRLHSFSSTRNLSPSSSFIKVNSFLFFLTVWSISILFCLIWHCSRLYPQLQHSSSSSSVLSTAINGGISTTRCNAVSSRFLFLISHLIGFELLEFVWIRINFLIYVCMFYLDRAEVSELADIDWDNIGFGLKPTDYMYVMKCNIDGEFSNGELQRFGNIEVSPSAGVLNYGQVCFLVFLYFHALCLIKPSLICGS